MLLAVYVDDDSVAAVNVGSAGAVARAGFGLRLVVSYVVIITCLGA